MPTFHKVMLGGTGALMPIITNLLFVDYDTLAWAPTAHRLLGYTVRVIVLFGLGGLVAYLHTTETQAFKLFQLGLGAPALLLGMLNGANIKNDGAAHPDQASAKNGAFNSSILFEAIAEAEDLSAQAPLKSFKTFQASGAKQFVQGFLGQAPQDMWFVIAGSQPTRAAAERQAAIINASHRGFAAEVYEPFESNKYYAVVIAAGVSQPQALLVKQQAIAAGLPKDTYLWTF